MSSGTSCFQRPFRNIGSKNMTFVAGNSKTNRYLTCAFLLLLLYLFSDSLAALFFMLVSFLLAIVCHRVNRRSFTL